MNGVSPKVSVLVSPFRDVRVDVIRQVLPLLLRKRLYFKKHADTILGPMKGCKLKNFFDAQTCLKLLWTPGLPEGVLSNRPCPWSVGPSVCL